MDCLVALFKKRYFNSNQVFSWLFFEKFLGSFDPFPHFFQIIHFPRFFYVWIFEFYIWIGFFTGWVFKRKQYWSPFISKFPICLPLFMFLFPYIFCVFCQIKMDSFIIQIRCCIIALLVFTHIYLSTSNITIMWLPVTNWSGL